MSGGQGLCSSGRPGSRDPQASPSLVLGLRARTITPSRKSDFSITFPFKRLSSFSSALPSQVHPASLAPTCPQCHTQCLLIPNTGEDGAPQQEGRGPIHRGKAWVLVRLDATTKVQRSSFWLDTLWKPQEFRPEIMHSGVVEKMDTG